MLAIGAVLSAYLGYLVNGAWKDGMEFTEFIDSLMDVLSYPLRDYYNEGTVKAVVAALAIYAVAMLLYYTSQRNFMPGKEYGTARLASPKEINKVLADKNDDKNRIFSQNVRMSLDTRKTGLNNNVLILGGSGSGKTFYEVKPNLMQLNTSFVVTDPKGEILRSEGEMLRRNGYNVRVINLLEMEKSDCYNPFKYIRSETDVVKLVTNLMSNTTPKNASSNDPFWEHAEGMFLQALFYYVCLEMPPVKRNMKSVMELLSEAEVVEKDKVSDLDARMAFLEATSPLGKDHPAVKQYNKCMRGAGDTVRSIIISANSRLAKLENKAVMRLLSKDDLNIEELGTGANADGRTKTALFCVIPDSDKSYNFIIGMLYSQIFQELYYQADFIYDGRLPIHVSLILDEFANVALPDDFCSLLSTMRSREISCMIIIQNLAQIKALFKDTWETITGNADTTIYLGGNEQGSHEYVSKLLGKMTIDKKSSGETKGRQGSSSNNIDVLGREILMPDEVRMMDNKKCLVFIRGQNPVMDNKYYTPKHRRFSQSADGNGEIFTFVPRLADNLLEPAYIMLTPEGLKQYEKRKENGEAVYIDALSYEDFMMLDDFGRDKKLLDPGQKGEMQEQFERQEESEESATIPEDEPDRSLVAELVALKKQAARKAENGSAVSGGYDIQGDGTGDSCVDGNKTDGNNSDANSTSGRYTDGREMDGSRTDRRSMAGGNTDGSGTDGSCADKGCTSNNRTDGSHTNCNGTESDSSLSERLEHMKFSPAQRCEIKRAQDERIPEAYILTYAYPENSVVKMAAMRRKYGSPDHIPACANNF